MNTNVTDAGTGDKIGCSRFVGTGASTRIRRNFFILIFTALFAACAGVRRFLTRPSRRELLKLLLDREADHVAAMNYIVKREAELQKNFQQNLQRLAEDAGHLRAQLMQLRCENSDPAQLGRIGWQVGAFIPQEVIDRVRAGGQDAQDEFTIRVARILVGHALAGIFLRNAAGNCTALVWEPLGFDKDGKASKKSVVSAWFEGDPRKPGIIYNSNDEPAIRRMIGLPGADEAAMDDAKRKLFLTAPARITE